MARKYFVELYESEDFFGLIVKTMIVKRGVSLNLVTGQILEADLPVDVISFGISKFDVQYGDGTLAAADYHSQYPKKLYLAICKSVEELVMFLQDHFVKAQMAQDIVELMCDRAREHINARLSAIIPSEN